MRKFEQAMEGVGQALFEMFDKDTPKEINTLLNCVNEGYVLIKWPESQELMEEEWFNEEAILALGAEDITGSSAYFIPIKRII